MRKLNGERLIKELSRLDGMLIYERKYEDYELIGGIDEAGRGPLAGPVVAACCILPKELKILRLNDSKKLTPKTREELFPEIEEKALSFGIGIVDEKRIDEINILNADYEAMRMALAEIQRKLGRYPDLLLNDAVKIPGVEIPQVSIIKGDAKSESIAAASVLAKVTRDRIMEEYDKAYPEYGFAKHKGYGTKMHIEAIRKYGPCSIHRRSFLKNIWKDEDSKDR